MIILFFCFTKQLSEIKGPLNSYLIIECCVDVNGNLKKKQFVGKYSLSEKIFC